MIQALGAFHLSKSTHTLLVPQNMEDSMTRFVVDDDRSQSTLFSERLEDYLSEARVKSRR